MPHHEKPSTALPLHARLIITEQQAPQEKLKVSVYPTKLTIRHAKQPEQGAVIDTLGRAIFHHIWVQSFLAQLTVNVAVRP